MRLIDVLKERSVKDSNAYRVTTMADILGDFGIPDPGPFPIAIVLGPYGIFCKEIQTEVKEILGGDFYILPSSIYELICIAKSDGFHPKELAHMVKEINGSVVRKEDQLSDDVFEIVDGEILAVGG